MQIACRLVILLELAGSCLECWVDLFQFVRLLGKLPDFLGWRFESLLVNVEKYYWRDLLQLAFHLVMLLELAVFLGWRSESLLVSAEKYCWRNLLQFAFHLVILLELAEDCLEVEVPRRVQIFDLPGERPPLALR